MIIPDLLVQITEARKGLDQVIRLLGGIEKLDKERDLNLIQIKAKTIKLKSLCDENKQKILPLRNIATWIDDYRKEVEISEKSTRENFGNDLEKALAGIGTSLSGHLPILKAGLFGLEVDFQSWLIKIWYGPEQELLDRCPISAKEVALRLQKLKMEIGSQLDGKIFFRYLTKACSQGSTENSNEFIPIIKALESLVKLLKEEQLWINQRNKPRAYNRADFSYDLFRLRNLNFKFDLSVATKANTRKRKDFLWIPENENGIGSTFSHIKF